MRRAALVGLLALSLSACATPETRLRTALVEAGLSQPMSACMAERMADRLSIWQLNKLRSLKKLQGKSASEIGLEEFYKRTKGLQDTEVLGVVTSSGVICAVTG